MSCAHTLKPGETRVFTVAVIPPPYECVFCELDRQQEEIKALRDALRESLDWATPFDGRHDMNEAGFMVELVPVFTRIGLRHRDDRLVALRKLVAP